MKKNKIKSTLWFTHPGPKFGIKKLILFLSFIISENIVTASTTSFPIKSKKVSVIGHAVDLVNFSNKKEEYKLHNFLILSRISSSKNIEIAIDGFLNSKFVYHELPINDPKQRKPDLTKAKELLNYKPKTSLEDGLKLTIDWISANYK